MELVNKPYFMGKFHEDGWHIKLVDCPHEYLNSNHTSVHALIITVLMYRYSETICLFYVINIMTIPVYHGFPGQSGRDAVSRCIMKYSDICCKLFQYLVIKYMQPLFPSAEMTLLACNDTKLITITRGFFFNWWNYDVAIKNMFVCNVIFLNLFWYQECGMKSLFWKLN